ncbi:acetylornithine transaminase [Nocardioides gilvus]|uniref:acetylornithine transaminase n=1 Tax=Nocardioides gilvus TaxID=1735589 RepID=UPI000D743BE5|nr:acetylornithine transaminase [Nocardioides gilvus]
MTWQERYGAGLMNTYGTPPLLLTRGKGAHVWDVDGKEYVDLLAGIAVNSLGHAHPAVVAAVTEQVSTLGHVSNLFASEPPIALAHRLLGLLGAEGRVFFSNSGTEANEAAFKLTRRTGRTHVVATEEAFHGRTMGALALTANAAYRTPFEPLPGHVTWVPFGDAEALAAAVTDETAAVVVEPLQGEAGVNQPDKDYLARVREITTRHGALMWLDEIQTGVGRTGTWFAHQNPALVDGVVVPDVITLAKGLGGGVPIGATIALGAAATLLEPGNHGTTFGGNPMATAAALAVLDTIESEGLLDHVTEIGALLVEGLTADARVTETRGAGLLLGLDLAAGIDAKLVVSAAMAAGWLINSPRPHRIRLAPPLVLTRQDAEAFVAAWPAILDSAGAAS